MISKLKIVGNILKLIKDSYQKSTAKIILMVKAMLYRQNLTQKHTHTHLQKEEKGKN